jgi:GT2 family glycosyltransferase
MLKFWKHAEPNVMGASFNIRNYPQRGKTFLKHSTLTEMLGLYSPNIGHVSLSGWHTVIPEVTKTQYVDWVPSTAVIYRRNILEQYIFDEFYESYSYLEDLDLGYTVSRIGRLAVIVDAGFSHYPSSKGRITDRNFGRYEVRNRIHFVRKHHLSLIRCYICLAIRITMSGSLGVIYRDIGLLLRALGNLEEIAWRHSVQ